MTVVLYVDVESTDTINSMLQLDCIGEEEDERAPLAPFMLECASEERRSLLSCNPRPESHDRSTDRQIVNVDSQLVKSLLLLLMTTLGVGFSCRRSCQD